MTTPSALTVLLVNGGEPSRLRLTASEWGSIAWPSRQAAAVRAFARRGHPPNGRHPFSVALAVWAAETYGDPTFHDLLLDVEDQSEWVVVSGDRVTRVAGLANTIDPSLLRGPGIVRVYCLSRTRHEFWSLVATAIDEARETIVA